MLHSAKDPLRRLLDQDALRGDRIDRLLPEHLFFDDRFRLLLREEETRPVPSMLPLRDHLWVRYRLRDWLTPDGHVDLHTPSLQRVLTMTTPFLDLEKRRAHKPTTSTSYGLK